MDLENLMHKVLFEDCVDLTEEEVYTIFTALDDKDRVLVANTIMGAYGLKSLDNQKLKDILLSASAKELKLIASLIRAMLAQDFLKFVGNEDVSTTKPN